MLCEGRRGRRGKRAVIYECNWGRDGRSHNGGRRTRALTQPRVKISGEGGRTKDDTLQLRDLTRGRKEIAARDRIRPECERGDGVGRVYWPRIRIVYLVSLVCSLTPIRRREKGGREIDPEKEKEGGREHIQKGEESAARWCLWYHCMQRNDPLQKETATQWGRRGEGRH